jgi:hypothetical protein
VLCKPIQFNFVYQTPFVKSEVFTYWVFGLYSKFHGTVLYLGTEEKHVRKPKIWKNDTHSVWIVFYVLKAYFKSFRGLK